MDGKSAIPLEKPPSPDLTITPQKKVPKLDGNAGGSADPVATDDSSTGSSSSNDGSSKSSKKVRFTDVSVYLFNRTQGFSSVPSCGGHTIGMALTHTHAEHMKLEDHEQYVRQSQKDREQLLRNGGAGAAESDESDEEAVEDVLPNPNQILDADQQQPGTSGEQANDQDENVPSAEYFKAGHHDLETDEEEDEDDPLAHCFFQPLSVGQRKHLLRDAGIDPDRTESVACQSIRESRQVCGCSCVDQCLPETCECAQMEIKCQVDRPSFPCGCTLEGCSNPKGRVEFNPLRVRSHHQHTMMRLRLQSRLGSADEGDCYFSPPAKRMRFEVSPTTSTYCDEPPIPTPSLLPPMASLQRADSADCTDQVAVVISPTSNRCHDQQRSHDASVSSNGMSSSSTPVADDDRQTYSLQSLYPHAVQRYE